MAKPVVLIILDGFGLRKETDDNAIAAANTQNLDKYFEEGLLSELDPHGEAVGLPTGFQGSSEVGHLNIGAGRIVYQAQVLINKAIESGEFFDNEAFLKAIANCKEKDSKIHLMGLLQDQGVHAHQNHLFALLELCSNHDVKPIIHVFTDGRDTPPKSSKKFFKELDNNIEKYGGEIKTVSGRYYSMDRDNRWDRTKLAYDTIANGDSEYEVKDWREAVDKAYERGEGDEFIKPTIIGEYEGVSDDDSIIFFNYRGDRARQITKAFVDSDFDEFEHEQKRVEYVCMAEYYKGVNAGIAFHKPEIKHILSEWLASKDMKTLHAAETEKYAHVTYFFNAEREEPFKGEKRILVPSPKVATYDLKPEMSAYEVTEKVLSAMKQKTYDFIVMNFANCDMVGHTGDFDATVKAVEAVDECVGNIVSEVERQNGVALITGDHGNTEEMGSEDDPITAHTTNKVPLCVYNSVYKDLRNGKLGDIAPTILRIMGLAIPKEMTGKVLVD